MNARASQNGFSLLELIIASVLLGVMLFSVASLSLSGADASDLSRRLTRSAEVTQEIVDDIRLELVSSVRVFGDDIEGNSSLAQFDLAGAPAVLPGSRLPTINSNGTIGSDTVGNENTGNALFFCRLAWSDRFVCTSSNEYLVDVVRWVYYYLTPEDSGPNPGNPLGLNLVRVVSEPIVDGPSIDRITDTSDQAEVLLHLCNASPDANGVTHPRCEIVWTRGEPIAATGTIRQIDPSSGSLSNTAIGGTGRVSPFVIERRDVDVSGMLYYRHHSVASNYSQPSFGVSTFAIQSNAGSGFPHGFETQVAGPSSARQVMIHLVLTSTNSRGHRAWSDMQVVVAARDL